MKLSIIIGSILYLQFINVTARSKKSKSVTTLLEAKWEVTPLILEVAEYLADENIDFYWSFIDSICDLNPPLVELGEYIMLELKATYLFLTVSLLLRQCDVWKYNRRLSEMVKHNRGIRASRKRKGKYPVRSDLTYCITSASRAQ